MRRGTTTMKMINSTSTTSTSGVMLISDCRSEPSSPLLSCMMSFSPRAGVLPDQPYPAESGIFDCDHGVTDLAEVEPCVAPDHDLGLRLGAHRSEEGFAEVFGRDRFIVDPQPASLVDGDQDPASLIALIGG